MSPVRASGQPQVPIEGHERHAGDEAWSRSADDAVIDVPDLAPRSGRGSPVRVVGRLNGRRMAA